MTTGASLRLPDIVLGDAARPPRVLLVVDSLDVGGAERYVVDLALALRERGFAPAVACSVGGVLEPRLAAGIATHPLVGSLVKRRFSLGYARSLRALVRTGRFDLVHANNYASAAAAALATVGSRVPLVVTEHTEAPWQGSGARAVNRWVHRRARHVIAVSTAIAEVIGGGAADGRVHYLPNAVPPPCLDALPPLSPSLHEARLVGPVSRLVPEKGVDVFLRAAARVAGELPDVQFVVVGDGPLRADLEALARRLGLAGRVEFLGYRAEAPALIAALDVLVVSSLSEGSPLVVLEARHAGVPVVASRVGGLPDQVRDGEDGLLVPPGDDDALAAGLSALLAEPRRARALGEAGRRRAREDGFDAMVDAVSELYAEALGARRSWRA
jgi:glycosyltransferase involved in cell wall biosynthesis